MLERLLIILVAILIILSLIVGIRIFMTKSYLKETEKLKKEFENYLNDKTDSVNPPNNSEFQHLWSKSIGDGDMNIPHIEAGRELNASVKLSFPSTEPYISIKQLTFLDNMIDYFKYQYEENFSVRFWLEVVIYFPQYASYLLGSNDDEPVPRKWNFVYWSISLISIIITVFKYIILQ